MAYREQDDRLTGSAIFKSGAQCPLQLQSSVPIVWDLDNTLLPLNVGSQFIRFLLAEKLICARKRFRFYLAYLLYHARILRDNAALREAHRLFVGMNADFLDDLAGSYLPEYIEALFFTEALERLDWHRTRGHKLILLSGSPAFLVRPIGAVLSFDHAIGTTYTLNGRLIAGVNEPIGFGDGKVILLQSHDLIPPRPHVYTDDIMDLPLLRAASSVSLVNPSPSFVRDVTSLGIPFEVLSWSRTVGGSHADK